MEENRTTGFVEHGGIALFAFPQVYRFLPHLRERANNPDTGYQHARRAYVLLLSGLGMMAVLFSLAGVTIAWMVYHGL